METGPACPSERPQAGFRCFRKMMLPAGTGSQREVNRESESKPPSLPLAASSGGYHGEAGKAETWFAEFRPQYCRAECGRTEVDLTGSRLITSTVYITCTVHRYTGIQLNTRTRKTSYMYLPCHYTCRHVCVAGIIHNIYTRVCVYI